MYTIELLLDELAKKEGYTQSYIPWVQFLRTNKAMSRSPMLYKSRIIIVGRGEKKWYLNGKTLCYNANNYLILAVPMSFECEAGEDVLALIIDIDTKLLGEVVAKLPLDQRRVDESVAAVHAREMNQALRDSVIRLLKIAWDAQESSVLWEDVLKEILYRMLQDKQRGALLSLYEENSTFGRFSRLIQKITQNLAADYTLGELAKDMAMSEISLNRYFKKMTDQSPLKYIKNMRLQKAKELIFWWEKTLSEIAKYIWYKSFSQFSREYKAFFWVSPKNTKEYLQL